MARRKKENPIREEFQGCVRAREGGIDIFNLDLFMLMSLPYSTECHPQDAKKQWEEAAESSTDFVTLMIKVAVDEAHYQYSRKKIRHAEIMEKLQRVNPFFVSPWIFDDATMSITPRTLYP